MPQLSSAVTGPQLLPCRAQNCCVVSGMHPEQMFGGLPPPPQTAPPMHVPQLAVREAPQLSVAVTMPQFLPTRVQKAASGSGVQPQTPAVPPPPHVCPAMHVPQTAVRGLPQRSLALTAPQLLPCAAQNSASVSGTQPPQTFAAPPPPQVLLPVHVPQLMVRSAPQLSVADVCPQSRPSREQMAASDSAMHWAQAPSMHVCGALQPPHDSLREVPQLSSATTVPQLFDSRLQYCATPSGTQPVGS